MMKTTIETSRKKGSKLGAILRVTSGNFLEQFDFFLFGFYATYNSRTFIPATSEFASLMMTFAVFGSGFLMRPLGAIILGAYIDKVGRRKGLIVTLSIMAAGTVLIALVPGYASIGIAAPVLVLLDGCCKGFLRVQKWAVFRCIWPKSPRPGEPVSTPAGNQPVSRWRSFWPLHWDTRSMHSWRRPRLPPGVGAFRSSSAA